MTRQRSAPADGPLYTEGPIECLLCGQTVQGNWVAEAREYVANDVCIACSVAFHDLARQVGRWHKRLLAPVPDVAHVPGQLELDEAPPPALRPIDVIRDALWRRTFDGVPTNIIAQVILENGEDITTEGLAAMRHELERRA